MLVKCPECELQVSDKAPACPHCGYPMKSSVKRKPRAKNNKRRRLPNGFGQISEIKNRNLRNPFRAMVTVGKTRTASQFANRSSLTHILQLIMTHMQRSWNTIRILMTSAPRSPSKSFTTSGREEYFKTLKSDGSSRAVTSAWKYCSAVYDMRVMDVRARHVKGCMDEGVATVRGKEQHASASMKNKIKSLFNLMLDYALEYEIVDRNYSRTFKLTDETIKEIQKVKKEHIPFTDEEISKLWKHVDDKNFVDVILIQCYSGWRPQELGLIELANVDLENGTFKGGIKTEAGEDRVVPIHSKIRHPRGATLQ